MSNKAIPHFIQTIKEADNHLRTGFLGTPLLAPVLNKIGRTDLFYEMLFKESYPSWFYSINQGATTLWERWDSYSKESGFGDEGMNSFNHYAYGAVGQWMYELITGIRPLEPGYRKIQISPKPPGTLTSAKGEYKSPYGEIVSEWEIVNGSFRLDVTIPPNTSARILFPHKPENILVNGNSAVTADYEGKSGMEITSGKYSFRYQIDKNPGE